MQPTTIAPPRNTTDILATLARPLGQHFASVTDRRSARAAWRIGLRTVVVEVPAEGDDVRVEIDDGDASADLRVPAAEAPGVIDTVARWLGGEIGIAAVGVRRAA